MAGRVFHLIFHGVGEPPRELDPGEPRVWVGLADLRSVLDAAAGRPDVRLTFDDGNASDRELVLPELLERGLRATFFVPAGKVGEPGFLTPDGVQELVEAGMAVQSHGMSHRSWRGLDERSLHEELVLARGRLEQLTGRPVDEVALPFCQYDRRVLRRLRAEGYRRVYTCDRGAADPGAWLQARNEVERGEDGAKVAEVLAPSLALRLEIALKTAIKRRR